MRKITSFLILLLVILPVFIIPLFGIGDTIYWIFFFTGIGLSVLSIRIDKEIFPTVLFFTLTHLARPINLWFTETIEINFPGTFFLIPILLFTFLIILFPKIRSTIGWWTKDKIDKSTIYTIVGLSVISGITLWIWGQFIAMDLSRFTGSFLNVSLLWTIINGIGFALLNSIAEEYLSRGMLYNGLEKIFTNKWLIIFIQAIVFSIFHYFGFPGGLIGIVMVFLWSIVLGWIRYRTKGLIGVITGHFFADLTIYFCLYSLI